MALIIKYKFHDDDDEVERFTGCAAENKNKKRKMTTDTKRVNVIDYSYIKLPALNFIQYLDQDVNRFIADCLRLAKKY